MEWNSLKGSSIQTVHSIELKFGIYIISHHRTNLTDFCEYRIHSFLQEYKKEFLYIRPTEWNFLKGSNIQTVHSIEFKFGMYIIDHLPKYCIDFGEFGINRFFTGAQKRIFIHYNLRSKIIWIMLASKPSFRLR